MVNESLKLFEASKYSIDTGYHSIHPGVKGPTQPRRRLNVLAIFMAVFVPWLVFAFTMNVLSFSVRYLHPAKAWFLAFAALLAVFVYGVYAKINPRWPAGAWSGEADAKWYRYVCVTGLVAWALAVVAGELNFTYHLRPYYTIGNLNMYPSANPETLWGPQLMDAGRVIFDQGAHLDFSKAMAFRNEHTYCVAPITMGEGDLNHYDFWAVGTDCCKGVHGAGGAGADDYRCGEYNNAQARGGLRLIVDDQHPFFRLAVQQAESKYHIRADHPVFFYWMQDPVATAQSYHDTGMRVFWFSICAFLSLQLFVTTITTLTFSKYGADNSYIGGDKRENNHALTL